jgi:hypothetical protein
MALRDVIVRVPDAEAYDTIVVVVPMPKGVIKGVELKQALADRMVASANDTLTDFINENGITWVGVDRQAKWV